MEEDDRYTKDGTVDRRGDPADKTKTGNWRTSPYILGNECCERLAYYGMSTNLVNYLKNRLNQGNATAANNVTNWSGTCYITPLIGAFVADAYLGRYLTIASFMMVYVLGLTLLTLTASVRGIRPSCDGGVCHPSRGRWGHSSSPCTSSPSPREGSSPASPPSGGPVRRDGREGEKEEELLLQLVLLLHQPGALVASSVLVWIQMNVGWGWGFGIPAVTMAVAVIFFFSGTRLYRHQKPGGSPLTRIAQILVASFRNWNAEVPADKTLLYELGDKESAIEGSRKLQHTEQLGFLDRAAVDTRADAAAPADPWRLCTVTQVEELKTVVRLLPIWASGIVFSTVYSQMSTMFVLQGNTLDPSMGPHFKIPAASLSIFDVLSVIVWVPLYDRIIVPVARRFTGDERGFSQLTRMGIGLVVSIFAMVAAGLLELVRLGMVQRHGYYDLEQLPLSIFWQVPQYFIIGAAEVFTFIGQLEFFYDQAPDAMRSMCSALSLTTVALGNYLSTLLVTIVTHTTTRNGKLGWIPDNLNRGHLDYFYWLLAILSLLNFAVYLLIARWYTYKKTTTAYIR
ncbi:unnamed protein product [Spirodela intermedia]|uniref:Uncharacterized protein n=1 Tax=Spirodela intermedia TaxID=51605 RepID=A0A7I8JH12_SPIIN|nr:unnamed protein product [Spirodela intermedia]CAA6669449.1 unnamed protein product [Spirodela intermedia]